MRSMEGQNLGHQVMLRAALQGAVPTEGPLSRRFLPGNREQMSKVEKEQAIQLCGRLEEKIEILRERHWNLLGRGEEDGADAVAHEKDRYERLLEYMEMKRGHPERIPPDTSRNPFLRG